MYTNGQYNVIDRNPRDDEIDGNRRNPSTSSSSVMGMIITLVSALLIYNYKNHVPPICDMKIAENRDFDRYYGISNLKNHFTKPAADECDSDVIFKPAFPPTILKADHSASSFLTLSKYGTGKTLLRCEYTKRLRSDKYLKISILNKQISEYLERFVARTSTENKSCEHHNCLHAWTDQNFAQLILSILVTELIRTMQSERHHADEISIEEKIELMTIICYYYNGFGTSELENFINRFVQPTHGKIYRADQAVVQIQERNIAQDKPLLIHLKKDLERFPILKRDPERLHLLLAVIEGEGFQHRAILKHLHGSEFTDLTLLSLFIKKYLNQIPVLIIDGIDENQYFFQKNSVNKNSIETFCRSSVSQELLSKVMANDFYLSIFYPEIDGINIQDVINRKDKFPVHGIIWNSKSLINYADYVLQEMKKNSSISRCRSFRDFKTLVNYSNQRIADIIKKIPTPRALHYFMIELIGEMNNDANDVSTPFIATFENVHNAYEKSYSRYNKIHQVN